MDQPLDHPIQICYKCLEAPDRLGIVFDADINPDFPRSDIHASGILPQFLQSFVKSNRLRLLLTFGHILLRPVRCCASGRERVTEFS
jgi:hypothetical protein